MHLTVDVLGLLGSS